MACPQLTGRAHLHPRAHPLPSRPTPGLSYLVHAAAVVHNNSTAAASHAWHQSQAKLLQACSLASTKDLWAGHMIGAATAAQVCHVIRERTRSTMCLSLPGLAGMMRATCLYWLHVPQAGLHLWLHIPPALTGAHAGTLCTNPERLVL